MRDYGKVSGAFWIGTTGKSLRGDMEAQIVAMYLMTSPHATMIGVYNLPVLYLAHETGLSLEGASKGLARCIDVEFCTYDEASETVFVHQMAKHQIGDDLKPGDKRIQGVRKQYDQLPESPIKSAFHAIYGVTYGLSKSAKSHSPSQAPSKGHQQEQEQEQEQERDRSRGSRLSADWSLPEDWRAWAKSERQDLDIETEAARFADYWHGVAGAKGRKADWPATWRNWIRNARGSPVVARNGSAPREPAKLPDLTL